MRADQEARLLALDGRMPVWGAIGLMPVEQYRDPDQLAANIMAMRQDAVRTCATPELGALALATDAQQSTTTWWGPCSDGAHLRPCQPEQATHAQLLLLWRIVGAVN